MALRDTFDEQVSPPVASFDLEKALLEVKLMFENAVLEIKRDAAERETRQSQMMLVVVGVILAAIAIATGVIIGFN